MKALIIGLLFLSSVNLHAQTYISYNQTSNISGVATINAAINSKSSVGGSTYLFKDWDNAAKIYTDNGKEVALNNINFNARDAMFSSKMSKDSIFTFYSIYKVEVDGKRFEKIGDKFYQVLYTFEDSQKFLKEYSVIIKPELHIITSTVIGPGKYEIEDELYLYKNGDLVKFWPSKKNVLKFVSSEKSLVLKRAKSRKLSFSKEEDIVEMFKYYDTL